MARPLATGKRPPVLLAILLTAVAPVLAYAAVRSAAYEGTRLRVDLSAGLPPASAWPELRRVMADARPGRRPPARDALAPAGRVARSAPLAFEPFFVAARVAEGQGRYDQATRLMEEAKRRRPNYVPTRLQLLSYYSLANAYQKAINEADASLRVRPGTAAQLLPAFVRLVTEDAQARRAIAVSLARNPLWETDFFNVASQRAMPPATAFALVEDIQRVSGARTLEAGHQQFLIGTLVRAGEYDRARRYWESARVRTGGPAGIVSDSSFESATPPPFGWTYYANADGVAERSPARGGEPAHLVVSYFGGAAVELADQTVVLEPGRYRLTSRARVESSADDVGLAWSLTCLPGNARLGLLALPLRAEGGPVSTEVDVPARCRAAELSLVGTPGDLPRALTAQIFEVSLRPLAGSRGVSR